MKRGDLVLHEFKNTFGILLEIRIDQKLMKHTFSVPWRYCVLWNNGHISEHDIGTLKRVRIHEQVS
jgi:hypothetical protein